MKKFSWENDGYLEGLPSEQLEIVKKFSDQIDFEKIQNDRAKEIIIPIIRHIIICIMDGKNHGFTTISDYEDSYDNCRGITAQRVLSNVNVNEIVDLWNEYYNNFIPMAEKYLTSIDGHAEATLLFCNNYLFKLILQTCSMK